MPCEGWLTQKFPKPSCTITRAPGRSLAKTDISKPPGKDNGNSVLFSPAPSISSVIFSGGALKAGPAPLKLFQKKYPAHEAPPKSITNNNTFGRSFMGRVFLLE